jgi:hypothetical protein
MTPDGVIVLYTYYLHLRYAGCTCVAIVLRPGAAVILEDKTLDALGSTVLRVDPWLGYCNSKYDWLVRGHLE